jgi:hypothetical protein
MATHALNGSITPLVWNAFWWTLPFLGVGLLAGLSLDRWLNPILFRRVILVLLVVMGVRLLY